MPREWEWWVISSLLPLFGRGKDLEVRVKNGYPEKIRREDVLFINEQFRRRVVAVREYPNFDATLRTEDSQRIYPGMSDAELLPVLRKFYPPHLEKKGVLVFELAKID